MNGGHVVSAPKKTVYGTTTKRPLRKRGALAVRRRRPHLFRIPIRTLWFLSSALTIALFGFVPNVVLVLLGSMTVI